MIPSLHPFYLLLLSISAGAELRGPFWKPAVWRGTFSTPVNQALGPVPSLLSPQVCSPHPQPHQRPNPIPPFMCLVRLHVRGPACAPLSLSKGD